MCRIIWRKTRSRFAIMQWSRISHRRRSEIAWWSIARTWNIRRHVSSIERWDRRVAHGTRRNILRSVWPLRGHIPKVHGASTYTYRRRTLTVIWVGMTRYLTTTWDRVILKSWMGSWSWWSYLHSGGTYWWGSKWRERWRSNRRWVGWEQWCRFWCGRFTSTSPCISFANRAKCSPWGEPSIHAKRVKFCTNTSHRN